MLLVAEARRSADALGELARRGVVVELAERPDGEGVELSGCQGHGLALLPASDDPAQGFEAIRGRSALYPTTRKALTQLDSEFA